jgi:uncharacterized membrane protein YeaQ/YmgE (transglycosylase-associated protein family)
LSGHGELRSGVSSNAAEEDHAMTLSTESILVILVVGIIAGWLAGKIVRGTGFGLIGDLLVGIAGAFVAAWLFPKLGIHLGTGIIEEIIYSALGAVILLLVVRLIRGVGRA